MIRRTKKSRPSGIVRLLGELGELGGLVNLALAGGKLFGLVRSDFTIAGWVAPFVLANGDVTFCCLSREVLGNLSESSFGNIWFSSSRRSLNETALRMHKTQEAVPNSRCLGCEQSFQNLKVNRFLWPLLGKSKASGTAAAKRRAV